MSAGVSGQRVAELRRQMGISQRDLASAVRRSESWVSQVERGVLPVERISVLQSLADALGVSVRDLRPDAEVDQPSAEPIENPVNDLDEVRLAITGHPALDHLFAAPRDIEVSDLARRVNVAWQLAHGAQHAELSKMLPSLLGDLELAVRASGDVTRPELFREMSRAYQAASAAFARQDEADASWLAADRAVHAAESAGNPLWVLAGHFRMAHAFIRLQRFDQAERVTLSALDALRPQLEGAGTSSDVLSLYGALNLVAAVLRAREGNRRSAHEHLDAATDAAKWLGADRNDFETEFGPTNVLLHRASIAVDLGDAGEALEIAEHVDPTGLSPERQARFWLDVARAHVQRRHVGDGTEALLRAERLSPELVRDHHLSRDAITVMARMAGDRRPQELRNLAIRAGVDV